MDQYIKELKTTRYTQLLGPATVGKGNYLHIRIDKDLMYDRPSLRTYESSVRREGRSCAHEILVCFMSYIENGTSENKL